MMFIAIVHYDGNNRITKVKDGFQTEQGAEDFVNNLDAVKFPNAFAVEELTQGGVSDWIVNPNTQTITYSPDINLMIDGLSNKIKTAMFTRIDQGVRWSLNNGSTIYGLPLTETFEKFLSRNLMKLNEGRLNPHKGFIFTGIDTLYIDDNGLRELATFAGEWGDEISRIRLSETESLQTMTITQLNAYDPDAIDWSVDWSIDPQNDGKGWVDDLCKQNP